MKTTRWFLSVLFFFLLIVPISQAVELPSGAQGAIKPKNHPAACRMRGMSFRQVVATTDGGVVVLTGNKLSKFDKNLNLVKQIELPGPGQSSKFDGRMTKGCPMKHGQAEDRDGAKLISDVQEPKTGSASTTSGVRN